MSFAKRPAINTCDLKNDTYGVHLSLYSLATVSIPPPRATAT